MRKPKYPPGFDIRKFLSKDTPHDERLDMARSLAVMYADCGEDGASAFQAEMDGTTLMLYLYGPIERWFGLSSMDFNDVLQRFDGQYQGIEIHINCPGGETFEALAIRNRLLQEGRNGIATRSVVDAYCASAATLIALACQTRDAYTDSFCMIHRARAIAFGTADDFDHQAEKLRGMDKMAAKIYADAMGVSEDEAMALMTAETTYNADEAKEAGLIDNVLDASPETGDDDSDENPTMLDDEAMRARMDAETQIYLTAFGQRKDNA